MIYYEYSKCSTCRAAAKWLSQRGITVVSREIRETPPTLAELQSALAILGDIRKLLNTSGAEYRSMGLKDRLPSMSEKEIFTLIQDHGNLCKRPFLLDLKRGICLTGFCEEDWQKALA